MPPKKASATGDATLQPLDPNQDVLSLREARSQKRKATSPTLQEDDLDQEIRNMEMLHPQVQRKKEKTFVSSINDEEEHIYEIQIIIQMLSSTYFYYQIHKNKL